MKYFSNTSIQYKNKSILHHIELQPNKLEGALENDFKNLGAHVTLATPPFPKILRDHVRTDPGHTRVKFEVCSFNCFGTLCI